MLKMKKLNALLLAGLIPMSLIFTGCGNSKDQVKDFKSEISFAGSSTLVPVIDGIKEDFTKDGKTTWNKINKDFPDKEIKITITSGGSGEGLKAVIDKTADLGLVSREVTKEEKAKIKDYKEFKLGTDALTLSVNPKNKILKKTDNLSTEQIKNIFSGKYQYWSDVDKSLPHKKIVVVTRDLSGGAHKVFQKTVMKDTKVKKDVIQAPSMGALASKIIENEYAIGYASYGVVNQNKGKLVPVKVDGIEPNKKNIVDGKYKITRPLLIIKSGDLNQGEKAFVDFSLSDKGQKVVEKLGFIPEK
ncbi:phosphate ABC transporter substrate-binding protein [Eubacterium multiforme]|uniref:Phosphate-binding protein n=1 Tax=Eubacterium multiforme TaxID=83339 RepID=A0ABT9USN1_9FIRM|nr:phosphate transport system substrate-binding protein [Eubacterium multiforme]